MLRMATTALVLMLALAGPVGGAAQGGPGARLLDLADEYLSTGRYLEALSFYRDIDRNGWVPGERARLLAGMAAILDGYLGDSAGARRLYDALLALPGSDVETAEVLHRRARACFRSGDREAADDAYARLMARFPEYSRDRMVGQEREGLAARGLPPEDVCLAATRPLPFIVRVLVAQTGERVTLSCDRGMRMSVAPGEDGPAMRPAGKQIHLSARGAGIAIGEAAVPLSGPVRIEPQENGVLQAQGQPYRGALEAVCIEGSLMLINHVPVEEYLYGVLPKEMSHSWPEHALKAQAVAARTYVLYHMIQRAGEPYDVFSTTSSQVYGGRKVEHPAVTRAVDETRGRILTCNDRIVLTLYHANSGGVTAAVEDVWGSAVPCLQRVADTFSLNAPGAVWDCTLSAGEIVERLGAFGIAVSGVSALSPGERAGQRRIVSLAIRHAAGTLSLSGNSFRLIMGPGRVKSADFEVQQRGDGFVLKGRGYGHGAGMSQWGARAMARNGKDYRAILDFYYPGARIRDMHAQ